MMAIKVASQQQMRQINAKSVFQLIKENQDISRATISKMTHLSPTTVSTIVEQLIERGMVVETVPLKGKGAGRKAMSLEVSHDNKFIIGIDLGPERIAGTVFNLRHDPVYTMTESFEQTPDALVQSVLQMINRLNIAVQDRFDELMGIGISVPALLDSEKETILLSTALNMENVNLHAYLAREVDAPIFIEDSTVLAATAEREWMGNTSSPFIYLSIDEGVGACIIVDDHYLQGANGVMLEIGHMSLDVNGELCQCGNRGCFERHVSTVTISQKVENEIKENPNSILDQLLRKSPEDPIEKVLAEAVNAGDSTAVHILSELASDLGNGIVNLIHIFNPETIVIGGGLAVIGDPLLDGVEAQVGNRAIQSFREKCTIRLKHPHENAVLCGASLFVLSKVLDTYFLDNA